MRVWLIVVGIVAVLGGGATLIAMQLAGDDAGAAAVVPKQSLAYVHVTLDPSLSQKRALASLTERLPDDAKEQLEKSVPKLLDEALDEAKLDYEQDIKPWLGGEAALFVTEVTPDDPNGGVLLETTDAEATLEVMRRTVEEELGAPEEQTHREVTYWVLPPADDAPPDEPEASYAVVGDFLVIGTTGAVEGTIDASIDGGIDGTASYTELTGLLTEDRLATYWADTPKLFDAMLQDAPKSVSQQFATSPLFNQQAPSAGAVVAAEDSVVFESASLKPEEAGLLQSTPQDAGLMASLPEQTWFSLVIPGVGKNITSFMDSLPEEMDPEQAEQQFQQETGLDLREDVLSWMEDGALFVSGDSVPQLGGALIIESNDAEATTSFLQRLVDSGLDQGVGVRPTSAGGLEGFELADDSIPMRVAAVAGERLVLAVDSPEVAEEDSALAGATGDGPTLAENDAFTQATAALGDDYAPAFFLDIGAATQVAKSAFGESSVPPEFTEAEPYLNSFSSVISGMHDDGEHLLQRLVVSTNEPNQ